jgi:hypothetical protein
VPYGFVVARKLECFDCKQFLIMLTDRALLQVNKNNTKQVCVAATL